MKKILAIVGLFLGLIAARAEAGTYITTNSTAVIIASASLATSGLGGGLFDITGVAVGSAPTTSLNTAFVLLVDTSGFGGQYNGTSGLNGCVSTFSAVTANIITPPLFFASSRTTAASDVGTGVSGGYWYYQFPNDGILVENGLVVCQGGGPTGVGGYVTIDRKSVV